MLHGAQHAEYLARLLGVDRKTVYRWRRGTTPVPDYVWEPLKVALLKRRNDIETALKGIE
jgi:predicted transcriptional regulator